MTYCSRADWNVARWIMPRINSLIVWFAVAAALSGCSSDMDQLKKQINDIRSQPGERIEPLREIRPYEAFVYNVKDMRSPFVPTGPSLTEATTALRPSDKRPREYLEQFPLDTLRMKGTMDIRGRKYGLVLDKQGLVHKVLPGQYLGQNEGRITGITASSIAVVQVVPDGSGGYVERPAQLTLVE